MMIDQQMIDSLDEDKIRTMISPENAPSLSQIQIFSELNSTNTYLLECAKSGSPSGTVCFAEMQTAGRGRLGRPWHSPRSANIYCSLLWYFSPNTENISALSLVIAVSLLKTLQEYGVSGVSLKWPNDVLIAERKLAGVLLESLPVTELGLPVVIGVGLNVFLLPSMGDTSHWIDLTEVMQAPIERNRLAGLLVDALLSALRGFTADGLAAFLPQWQARDALLNHVVTVHTAQNTVVGTALGVNQLGELKLQISSGEILCFPCGEVSVRR